jgi:predicted ATPase/class 3 adenylate cyclase
VVTSHALVAIVFTDLVGSTAMASRLGVEANDAVRRKHFRVLERAAGLTGGRVVKNLGDGLMVAYPSASEAIAGTVAMQQGVHESNESAAHDQRVEIRVGLAAGEAVLEEDDVFGTPVVEAARLCARAGTGQILATQLTVTLAGGRGSHRVNLVGPLELKGLPEPVPTVEIEWSPPAAASPVELPAGLVARADASMTSRFVARVAELDLLSTVTKTARGGERRAVLISGEPGIGKTRLAAHFARAQHDEGATVLLGRCDSQVPAPYRPFLEALGHLIRATPTYDVALWARAAGPALMTILPELREHAPEEQAPTPADAYTERLRLFDAVDRFLATASQQRPLILLLDDLHWADQASVLLLRHLMTATGDAPLLVIGTYRVNELDRDHPLHSLVADRSAAERCVQLGLGGLDEASTAELIAAQLDSAPDAELARSIYSDTEGNPFFVQELLADAADADALRSGRSAVPISVREVVGGRVARLTEGAQQVLRVAAVVGREFDVGTVAGAGGFTDSEVLDATEEAVDARLAIEIADRLDRFTFSHPLTREALYAELTGSRRARLHRTVARTLAERHAADDSAMLGAIAYHYFEGRDDGDVERAVDYARRAGASAIALLAYEEAARHFELALRAIDGWRAAPADVDDSRLDLYLAVGDALYRAGRIEASRDAFQAAAELASVRGDHERLARAALGFCAVPLREMRGEPDDEALALLDRTLAMYPDDAGLTRAKLLYQLARASHLGGEARFQALAAEAEAMAKRVVEPEGHTLAVEAELLTLWGTHHAARRLELASELLHLAEVEGDTQRMWWARLNRAMQSATLGDLDAVEAEGAALARLAEQYRRPEWLWYPALWRAMRALADGRLDDAEELIAEALGAGQETYGFSAVSVYVQQLFRLRDLQGRVTELEVPLQALVDQNDDAALLHVAMAAIHASAGRHSEASAEFDRVAVDDFAAVPANVQWPLIAAFSSIMIAYLGRPELAPVVYERLLPYRGLCMVGGPACETPGSVDSFLGVLATVQGDFAEADVLFGDALAMNRQMANRPAVAETLLRWSEMLLLHRNAPGDVDHAVELLREARTICDETGIARFPDEARAFLASVDE